MKMIIKKRIPFLLMVFSIFLASCSGKINKENYDTISNGMSISEVESILGPGESQAASSVDLGEYGGNMRSEVYTWQSDGIIGAKIISITFTNGKVQAKAQTGL